MRHLLYFPLIAIPLLSVMTSTVMAAMNYQGIGGWRTSDGRGGWVLNDDAENRYDIGINACKQACESNDRCRGIEYVSDPNGWEEEGQWVHNKCEIHRDPYAHCDQSGGGRGSAEDGCWIKREDATTATNSCQPYFEDMFSKPAGTQYQVHGTHIYYEGAFPDNWHFSILTKNVPGPNGGTLVMPPLSDETDHFILTKYPLGVDGIFGFRGAFNQAASPYAFSRGKTLVIGHGEDGSPYKTYIATYDSTRSPPTRYTEIFPECFRINDTPAQFAIKATHGEGSWVINKWLFSLKVMN
ncbi:hypothetical protein SAMN05660964_00725 [Thiothrix caldifontis]|uniref:Apple domain-containing protein n=1 Tax=Thiothrix caldifontis TaxID=525918 RepID=A0A1H3XKQ4_9GAMM|nr:hypothetical protein [Thiothrix caldifontis]SDZ99830.1 hypothetical protein SAMN05660964_00725 [Thiothrix caldifontis]